MVKKNGRRKQRTTLRLSVISSAGILNFMPPCSQKIIEIVTNIPSFPESGRIVPEYQDLNLREKIFQNYRVIYRIKGKFIEIVTISHAAKLLSL